MDDREFFQLELFQYDSPRSRGFARQRRPWDIGYSRLALEVNDPVAFHATCERQSIPGLSPVRSIAGRPRFTLLDPNGVLLEVGPAARPVPPRVGARFVVDPCLVADECQPWVAEATLDAQPLDVDDAIERRAIMKRTVSSLRRDSS